MKKKEILKSFDETTLELAQILKADPSALDKNDFEIGKEIISIFEDLNFSKSLANYKVCRLKCIQEAISDLSTGAENLKSGAYGVQFLHNQFSNFYNLHNEKPDGTVAYSISLKEFVAFKNWRLTEGDEFPQEKVNHSIYYLTAILAQNL